MLISLGGYYRSAVAGEVTLDSLIDSLGANLKLIVPPGLEYYGLDSKYLTYGGKMPVASDSDPVGMALDVSKKLDIGQELVTNGEFDTDLTGWVATDGPTIAWQSIGAMEITFSGGFGVIEPNSGGYFVPSGKTYVVSFDLVENNLTADRVDVRFTVGSGIDIRIIPSTPVGNYTFRDYASSDTLLQIKEQSVGAGDTIVVDNFSIKAIPGNHLTQPTSADRMLYRNDGTAEWMAVDDVDDKMTATVPASADYTVIVGKPTGAVVSYPVDLSGGVYTLAEDAWGVIVWEGDMPQDLKDDSIAYLDDLSGAA